MNILISCAGRRNELVSYFNKCEKFDEVHCADMNEFAPSWQYAKFGHITPKFAQIEYVPRLLNICKTYKIDLLLSLNDFELPILAKHKNKFQKIGTDVLVSSEKVIDICWDKLKTHSFLQNNGFDVPAMYNLEDNNITFPMIIKPRFGTASIGVGKAENMEEFNITYPYLKYQLEKSSIKKNEVNGGDLMIQQMIKGQEYAVDIINNFRGEFCGAVIKRKLATRGGDASLVITEFREDIYKFCESLSEKLRHIGNLDIDLIINDQGAYCVDLNPRFGGAYPFSHLSGIDLPSIIAHWMVDSSYKPEIMYEDGIITARTEGYLLLDKYKSNKKIN